MIVGPDAADYASRTTQLHRTFASGRAVTTARWRRCVRCLTASHTAQSEPPGSSYVLLGQYWTASSRTRTQRERRARSPAPIRSAPTLQPVPRRIASRTRSLAQNCSCERVFLRQHSPTPCRVPTRVEGEAGEAQNTCGQCSSTPRVTGQGPWSVTEVASSKDGEDGVHRQRRGRSSAT